jgi:hypothetical protein
MADAIKSMLDEAARGPSRVRHDVERFTEQASVDQYLYVLGARTKVPANVIAVDGPDTGTRA